MFFVAKDEEIKEGLTTDIYFIRTEEILRSKGINRRVVAEFTVNHLENPWGVFVGLPEIIELMKGLPINMWALKEGTVFTSRDDNGTTVPVIVIEGNYLDFARFETPMLGFICEASGIATKAARVKKLAGDKSVLSFGIRRMHPALAPMIDRAAFIGGCDGVSSLIGARTIGHNPTGTVPHALIISMGGVVEAVKTFDEIVDPAVPRMTLVDTFGDEKFESLLAAKAIGKHLSGVRLDTPSSRRGSIADIVREVKWELKVNGFDYVKVFVSGGLNEDNIAELVEAGVDGFGVGTSIANANTIDFAMDIVEIDGKPLAKRGKFAGRKSVFKAIKDGTVHYKVVPFGDKQKFDYFEEALVPVILDGTVVYNEESADEVRNYVLSELSEVKVL
ncbi:MAG: nicotinate phosphoribosyltransferase [Caldisericaceae bacterium]